MRRYLILLALGCAGNAPTLDVETAQTVRSHALEILPTRSQAEEDLLADAGPSALAWLHATSGALSASYEAGGLSAQELQTEIDRLWREMRESSEQAELTAAGVDREALAQLEEVPIRVYAEAAGIDPSSVMLTIVFAAPTDSRGLKSLWATVLLPRIRQRWGSDAVGAESQSDIS